MIKDEALNLALEALDDPSVLNGVNNAKFFIKQALAQPPLPVQPVAYDKTEMNSFVIDLYEEKMKEGKHGHYEALLHCVHQAIAKVTSPAAPLPVQEPVKWR